MKILGCHPYFIFFQAGTDYRFIVVKADERSNEMMGAKDIGIKDNIFKYLILLIGITSYTGGLGAGEPKIVCHVNLYNQNPLDFSWGGVEIQSYHCQVQGRCVLGLWFWDSFFPDPRDWFGDKGTIMLQAGNDVLALDRRRLR